MTYTFAVEKFEDTYAEIEPLYRQHYGEMQQRLAVLGVDIPGYNPRLDVYLASAARGDLLHFVVRCDGVAVGYSNVYVFADMHNQQLSAQEDTIYVDPKHRNGIGRKLTKMILEALRGGGVKKATMTAQTDPRAVNLWKRLGFKHTAHQMTYTF